MGRASHPWVRGVAWLAAAVLVVLAGTAMALFVNPTAFGHTFEGTESGLISGWPSLIGVGLIFAGRRWTYVVGVAILVAVGVTVVQPFGVTFGDEPSAADLAAGTIVPAGASAPASWLPFARVGSYTETSAVWSDVEPERRA